MDILEGTAVVVLGNSQVVVLAVLDILAEDMVVVGMVVVEGKLEEDNLLDRGVVAS